MVLTRWWIRLDGSEEFGPASPDGIRSHAAGWTAWALADNRSVALDEQARGGCAQPVDPEVRDPRLERAALQHPTRQGASCSWCPVRRYPGKQETRLRLTCEEECLM